MAQNTAIRTSSRLRKKQVADVSSQQALLISEVAHNLRQSTASIEMMLRAAEAELRKYQIPEIQLQAKYIRMANSENERLAAQLSSLAGVYNRTDPIARSVVDLYTVLERTRTFVQPHLSAHQQPVKIQFQDLNAGTHLALSHADELTAILIQLVENGIKYAADPRTERRPCVIVRVAKWRRAVKITVLDNGPGIPEAAIDRIWQPHIRLPSNNPGIAGSGLGLFIVHNLVSRLDGHDISVQSRYGAGTKFELTVPDAKPFLRIASNLCHSTSVV
jgi:signal transduction histidine kinase